MPVGLFRGEEGWVQVDYGTGTPFRSRAQSTRQMDISRISINYRQKRSIGPRRKMMPRGLIGNEDMWW